jgi:hypothetical protein
MIFFIAEGLGCLDDNSTIKEIELHCGSQVYPAFGCAANISCNLIYQLGFKIFGRAMLQKKVRLANKEK